MDGLCDLLARHARETPDAKALHWGEAEITYAQLWRWAGAVAGALRANGVRGGDRVALLDGSTPHYVAALYGIWRAGGVAVPLEPRAPAKQGALRIAHSQAQILLVASEHSQLEATLSACPSPPRTLDPAAIIGAAPLPFAATDNQRLAMILYTSGTTGHPKGVMLSHANLASNTHAVLAALGLEAGDRALLGVPLQYAFGNSVLHTHLAAGACLYLEDSWVFPHQVMDRIARDRVTGLCGVPSTYALLLHRTELENYDLRALRYLLQAGGPLPRRHRLRLQAALPRARLFVMYGQTEATARITCMPPERLAEKPDSVGVPIADTRLQIRDAGGNTLPAGQAGDVWVRGPGVMLGYWRDRDATARVRQDGWLWTGDVGRCDEEGFLYLHGRSNDIIKTGAHRVAPQQIEEIVTDHPSVREAVAIGVDHPLLGEAIKLVVVAEDAEELDARTLRRYCLQRMPAYMVPVEIEFVSELPRTPAGKISRALCASLGNESVSP